MRLVGFSHYREAAAVAWCFDRHEKKQSTFPARHGDGGMQSTCPAPLSKGRDWATEGRFSQTS